MHQAFGRFTDMLNHIKRDVDRYTILSERSWLIEMIASPGIWLTAHYRFSRWVDSDLRIPIIRQVIKAICFVLRLLFKLSINCELPSTTDIGPGLFLPHPYGIVVHRDAQIGENCNLSHDVTIGWSGRGDKSGVPCLGDRVFIAPGAKIFGKITIGNDVAIGANAVVNKSLPASAVAAGIPAKIVNYDGSKDFVIFEENPRISLLR